MIRSSSQYLTVNVNCGQALWPAFYLSIFIAKQIKITHVGADHTYASVTDVTKITISFQSKHMHVYALIYRTAGVGGLVRSCLATEDNTRQVCLQNWTWEKRRKWVRVCNRINFTWFHWFLIWLYCMMHSMCYLISHKTFPNYRSISFH